MEKQIEKTNFLTLQKCAYIFDSTFKNLYYGTAEQREQRKITQTAMQEYYYHPEKLIEKFPYTISENGDPIIIFNGNPHRLNALQIATISDQKSVINHRRHIDPDEIAKNTPHFHRFCSEDIRSNKYRTLYFEFFTKPGALGYIRVHFKGSHEQFIIDDRDGKLYTSGEYGQHKPTTAATIATRLRIESNAAKSEFYEVINAITKTEVKKKSCHPRRLYLYQGKERI